MSQFPLFDVIAVEPLDGYKPRLTFEDGASGVVDIAERIQFTGVFAPLEDLNYFRQVKIDAEGATICWENGVDLDPVVLYCLATGRPVPSESPYPHLQVNFSMHRSRKSIARARETDSRLEMSTTSPQVAGKGLGSAA